MSSTVLCENFLSLHDDVNTSKTNDLESKPRNDKFNQARKSTVKTQALVAFCYIFCWSWNQIYYLMFNLGYPADFSSNFYHFTVMMLFSNAVVNPFIYTFQYANFQLAAKQLFCRCCMKNPLSTGDSWSRDTSIVSIS